MIIMLGVIRVIILHAKSYKYREIVIDVSTLLADC